MFLEPSDFRRYLALLREEVEDGHVEVWAYCLMPNHVHLVMVPHDSAALARAIHGAHGRYARWLHWRTGQSGHLWANRYYSCPMDDVHTWAAARYVELNPVRSGLVNAAVDWMWSSARAHVLGEVDGVLALERPFRRAADWADWLATREEDPMTEVLRARTADGHPAGSPAFVDGLEESVGRPLRPRRAPRP